LGLIADLSQHQLVCFDSNAFIYAVEATDSRSTLARELLRLVADGDIEAVTSTMTVLEIMVHPFQRGEPDVANEYATRLESWPHLRVIPVDLAIARRAAQLRARLRLKPIDAIQLATAQEAGATALVTNDRDFGRIVDVAILHLDDDPDPNPGG
jgi:predicted nucleic acid-binding protein